MNNAVILESASDNFVPQSDAHSGLRMSFLLALRWLISDQHIPSLYLNHRST